MGTPVAWLTRRELVERSGFAFERGERYWREGRVRDVRVQPEAVSGRVIGSREDGYSVALRREDNRVRGECECPVGEGGAFCKHQVALGLAVFSAPESAAAAPGSPPVAAGAHFARTAELRAWLEQRELLSAFYRSAVELLPLVPEADARAVLGLLAVEPLHVLCATEACSPSLAARLGPRLPLLRAAAWERLQQLAADADQGRAEEALRLVPPGGPVALRSRSEQQPEPPPAWWEALLHLRARVRAGCAPASEATLLGEGFTAEPSRCAWRWRPLEGVVRRRYEQAVAPVAAVEFEGSVPRVHCSCEVSASGGCAHRLHAIDALLVRVRTPETRAAVEALVTELARPAWSRVLSALDALDHAPPRTTELPQISVAWCVDRINGLQITPLVCRRLKTGGLSEAKPLSVSGLIDKYGEVLDDADLRIARVVADFDSAPLRTVRRLEAELLTLLSDHPRVTSGDGRTPLRIAVAPLELRVERQGDALRLRAGCGELTVEAREALDALVSDEGRQAVLLELDHHRAAVATVAPELRATLEVVAREGNRFPPESEGALLDRLTRLAARMRVAHQEGVLGLEVPPQPAWSLVLSMDDRELRGQLLVRPLPAAPPFAPGEGPREVPGAVRGQRVFVRRDFATERIQAQALFADLPLRASQPEGPFAFRFESAEPALALISQLRDACPEGLNVEWEDRTVEVLPLASAKALRVEVDRKQDWFGLSGFAEISGARVQLAVLLDAARRDQRFARVDANRWVEVDAALRGQLLAVADHTWSQKRGTEISPGAMGSLEALEQAGARVSAEESWEQLGMRLRAAGKARPRVPSSLQATLRDYQEEGFRWLSRLSRWAEGAVLADDMGLGKTVQALALLLERASRGPALVVAPTSVCFNWVEECQRFAPQLRPVLLGEGDRARALESLRAGDLLIVSYGLLPRAADVLAAKRFSTVIFDEAQLVKNATTQRAKAARALQAEFRVALSGTPLENNLAELWSLFRCVFPSLLGSWEQFRERFASPIERTRDPAAMAALSRVLRPFLLRRTKDQVARELPPRTEIVLPVVLSEAERALYEDARLSAVSELMDGAGKLPDAQRRIQVLAALTRLRLLASHPRLYEADSPVASAKMEQLLELLEELRSGGHRALVFSQFTSHLALVQEALDAAGFVTLRLQGDTPTKERAARVKAFQAGQGEVFLISLKAGGTGLNLTGADYVIHLDPWWNPAVEDQATDRAHRIGQDKPVTVYRLVSRGTIEEKILAMHHDKRSLVTDILEGTGAAAKLSTRELMALLEKAELPLPPALSRSAVEG